MCVTSTNQEDERHGSYYSVKSRVPDKKLELFFDNAGIFLRRLIFFQDRTAQFLNKGKTKTRKGREIMHMTGGLQELIIETHNKRMRIFKRVR